MARWQDLLDNLDLGARLMNPYRFKTKGEMLSECREQCLLAGERGHHCIVLITHKGSVQKLSPGHCGYCMPCLIRRASIHAAFNSDSTTYSIPDLYAQTLDAKKAESTDVRAFQMMSRRLKKTPALADILVYKTGPLGDYLPEEVAKYAAVFRRGIAEVGTILDDVVIDVA